MAFSKRMLAWLLDAAGAEVFARATVLIIAVVAASRGLLSDGKTISWSIAGSFGSVFIASQLRRSWEYRHENYRVLWRKQRMVLKGDGTKVVYEVRIKIRSSQKNLRSCALRLTWGGETDVSDPNCFEALVGGFSIEPTKEAKRVDFKFDFERPVHRFRTATVGIRFNLDEPDKKYPRRMSLDPRAWAWSPFASLTTELIWENGLVNADRIHALSLRSGWDRARRATGVMHEWRDLKQVDGFSHSRRWRVTPLRTDRFYILEFALSEDRRPRVTPEP